jgi:hypothetical protein
MTHRKKPSRKIELPGNLTEAPAEMVFELIERASAAQREGYEGWKKMLDNPELSWETELVVRARMTDLTDQMNQLAVELAKAFGKRSNGPLSGPTPGLNAPAGNGSMAFGSPPPPGTPI